MKRFHKGGCPNPLFEKWLIEMKEQAEADDNPVHLSFGKALSSLRKCPIRLETGKDCLILQYFGKKICDILDKKLEEYKKTNILPSTSRSSTIHHIFGDEDVGGKRRKKSTPSDKVSDQGGPNKTGAAFKLPQNVKSYIPKVGSGAYALLITLHSNMQEPDYPGYMLKKDLLSQAQKHCDSPMAANAIEHYSGWSAMSTLITKFLVLKSGNPARYSLTDLGVALALSLIEASAKHHHDSDHEDARVDHTGCRDKPQNTAKSKEKAKTSSSVSSPSGSATASTSEKPQSLARTHDEIKAALTKSSSDIKSEKPHNSNASSTEAAFKDDLEMALALSLNETKKKNNDDEDLKKALAMSLNESNMKYDVELDGQDDAELDTVLESMARSIESEADLGSTKNMNEVEVICLDSDDERDIDNSEKSKLENRNVDDDESYLEFCKENAEPKLFVEKNSNNFIFTDDPSDHESNAKNDGTFVHQNSSADAYSHSTAKKFLDAGTEVCKNDLSLVSATTRTSPEKINPVEEIVISDEDENISNQIPVRADVLQSTGHEDVGEKRATKNGASGCGPNKIRTAFQLPEHLHSYNPKVGSGPYAILMTLYNKMQEPKYPGYMLKKDLMPEAEKLCNSPLLCNGITNFSCCPAMNTLISNFLVSKSGNPPRFILSDWGAALASSLIEANGKHHHNSDHKDEDDDRAKRADSSILIDLLNASKNSNAPLKKLKETPEDVPYDSFVLLPNKFDIVLLVDTQETSGSKKKPTEDATISALTNAGVLFEVRSLKVGDFAWIARCIKTGKELILPYIVERKRIDDLAGSITDGRYHEQKHRLRQSGIKNVVYLIEHYGKTYHGAIPLTSLYQAAINTTVQDCFVTKFAKDHKASMLYLAILTKRFKRIYKGMELISCSKKQVTDSDSRMSKGTERLMEFSEFNKAALKTKQFTVREMLIKQLVQLKGMSAEKAIGIADLYPSPRILAKALRKGGKDLLADIEVGSARRKIGPTISNVLHMFYTGSNVN